MLGILLSEVKTPDTFEQAHKLRESLATRRLSRMRRSMSLKYPEATIRQTQDGIGVYLAGNRSLHISTKGGFRAGELSDLLALFVVWLRVEESAQDSTHAERNGSSATERPQFEQSSGRLE